MLQALKQNLAYKLTHESEVERFAACITGHGILSTGNTKSLISRWYKCLISGEDRVEKKDSTSTIKWELFLTTVQVQTPNHVNGELIF